jgi:hypothetical protein
VTGESLLIDDFASSDGVSRLGTTWKGFTDRVMGGRSDMQTGYRASGQGKVLYMQGVVRLDNNGGFIQLRLPLAESGEFDASEWAGIRLRVKAAAGPYFIHLRTGDSHRPWTYYRAPIPVRAHWETIEIPFSAFQPKSLKAPLDLTSLQSLGLVAYGERFNAELAVARIELFKNP